ncbi:hypothetical protein BDW22DRAFT_1473650 [Trametopsis cervina]|nr:hypothetical protein BDW22DRAFT_1473650 [Trametopsis cervina]
MALSAQDFIRALKASSDPPQPGGPSKLEIARKTWDDESLYVPNKQENIVEWILTRLLKEKDAVTHSNPLLDVQIWTLLHDILQTSASLSRGSLASRPLRTWLLPLLNRIPTAPILVALFTLVDHESPPELLYVASKAFALLWPMAVPKIGIDSLQDCYGSVTRLLAQPVKKQSNEATDASVFRLVDLVVASYRSSSANSSAKKKLLSQFVQNIFLDWLRCTSMDELSATRREIYQAGIDTLFNIDMLRHAQGRPDDSIEAALRGAIESIPDIVLMCIPRIFQSYIQVTQKHRNTLFSQGSSRGSVASTDQARTAGMKFFASCQSVIGCAQEHDGAWRTTVALLDFVDAQRLVGHNDEAATDTLRAVAESACELLGAHKPNPQIEHALAALAIITHIDYELVAPILPRILRIIATRSLSKDRCGVLLDHVLDYNAKTRSADAVVELLLTTCRSETFDRPLSTFQDLYSTADTGVLLHHTFLDKLANFIHTFTTPGQISNIVDVTLEKLRVASEEFEARSSQPATDDSPVPRKKRKTDKAISPPSNGSETSAISFSLISGIASVVLTSLPLHLLQDNERLAVIATLQEFYRASRATIRTLSKQIRTGRESGTWSLQLVLAALSRLRYSLGSDRKLSLDEDGDAKLVSKLTPVLEVVDLVPQLRLEILRIWLLCVERERTEPTSAFAKTLDFMEKWLPRSRGSWDGVLSTLTADEEGQSKAAVAILYTLLDRWISVFDALATTEQCQRLVGLISLLQAKQASGSEFERSGIRVQHILHRTLHNAVFWESHNLRDALLNHITEQTASIDDIDFKKLLSSFHSGKRQAAPSELPILVAGVFGLLMSTPMEYLTRKARSDLTRRAQAADIALSISKGSQNDAVCIAMLREFLRRMYEHSGSVDHAYIAEYLLVLMDSSEGWVSPPPIFTASTLELIRMHLSAAVKLSGKDDSVVLRIIDSFMQSSALNSAPDQTSHNELRILALVQAIDTITAETKAAEYEFTVLFGQYRVSEALRGQLLALRSHLARWLLPHMHATLGLSDTTSQLSILKMWHRLLILSQWVSINETYPAFGPALTSRQLATPAVANTEVLVVILSIVQAEPQGTDDAESSNILATYLAFSRLCHDTDRSDLDNCMGKFCRAMTQSAFGSTLDLIYEGLSLKGLSTDSLVDLIHGADIIMRNSPEGSLKLMQSHLSSCLTVFADYAVSDDGGKLRDSILAFMGDQFNDRPAMIRQQDLSSVWSILGACLAGLTRHDSATSPNTFTGVVAVISALLRLRRDLIVTTLPHLGFILRRLIMTLRRLRPHLGGKQTRIVADTLPSWINPHEAARPEDSRAIARLLTTLTTKTIVRTYGSSENQKAESLARPFSKHAAYVLCAYIDALNDPLAVLPVEIRKELEPGLFALCDMMGENNRDAVMVASLDAGGKTIMKTVWREYEKQKYVGKG